MDRNGIRKVSCTVMYLEGFMDRNGIRKVSCTVMVFGRFHVP